MLGSTKKKRFVKAQPSEIALSNTLSGLFVEVTLVSFRARSGYAAHNPISHQVSIRGF